MGIPEGKGRGGGTLRFFGGMTPGGYRPLAQSRSLIQDTLTPFGGMYPLRVGGYPPGRGRRPPLEDLPQGPLVQQNPARWPHLRDLSHRNTNIQTWHYLLPTYLPYQQDRKSVV